MNIYLVRHGQDDESVRGGWCEHGLLDEGKRQSQLLGEKLSEIAFDAIFSSDLTRAVETTEIILSNLVSPLEIYYTSNLREINNGLLAGMKHELAEERFPGLYYKTLAFNERYPLGESPQEFYQRISNYWKKIITNQEKEDILIVTHGGVINIIFHLLNNVPYT
ncbi:histidine phosphatase family protein, partial [Enterococcus saccharolyticus]|uniref:histidine phosphatase family protein n=1 Tax=Enterococcus saccharolyticus TaxID=41997 RepID=UPI001E3A9617